MALTRKDIQQLIQTIQSLYLSDNIPWICGYSGGKDSTAVVQLVWQALMELPEARRYHKQVHVISTDTLVESPVVSIWAKQSIAKMEQSARENKLPITPHLLRPKVESSFWVNLIGRGYPYPRPNFRWCTDRLKIEPSNAFIKEILTAESEAILVLGSRKSESTARRSVMEGYEKQRYRDLLSPNGSYPNSYIFTPIENWTNDDVWQYLMQYDNPWGHLNGDLLAMYSGASADGECPLVIDNSAPSCGNSRFGCWVCTMVTEDKSMAAMIKNDEEKAWMLPLLDFRNYIAGGYEVDRERRDFRRMTGKLTWHNETLVHGPYTKKTREDFLRRLLEVEKLVHKIGPKDIRDVPLITAAELSKIRSIWLNEKHEFDDSLPRIFLDITGKVYIDTQIVQNKYYEKEEWDLLHDICGELFPDEILLLEMQGALLDIEAKASMKTKRRNIMSDLEKQIRKAYYKNEQDALECERERRQRLGLSGVESVEAPAEEEIGNEF